MLKSIALVTAGLALLAWGLIFGEFGMSRGIFYCAPAVWMIAAICLGFGVLAWMLDVPSGSPKMAREFMELIYETAESGAESCIVFRDQDGWYKFLNSVGGEGEDSCLAAYDRVERKRLGASIREYLADPENPGFLKAQYLPDKVSSISYKEDEDGDVVFVLIYKKPEDAVKVIDYGEDELVSEANDL